MPTLKADIIEIRPRNEVLLDLTLDIYRNGRDNAYPTRIERVINQSVTASQCRKLLAKFIKGRGFEAVELDSFIFGQDMKGEITGLILLSKIADSLATHGGVFLHLNFNLLGQVTGISVLPYRYCRLSNINLEDGTYSQIAVYDNWDYSLKMRFDKSKVMYFDLFNPTLAVQRMNQLGGNYGGQVAFFSMDDTMLYPLAPIDPAISDADTEAQIAIFKNRTVRNGFLDRTIFRHSPFESDEDKNRFKSMVRQFKGAENAEDILLLEDEFTSDNKDGNLRIDRLESKINDKLFESWESTCPNNIRKVYNNAPPMLIDAVEGKLGNTSGEAYREAIDFYNDQTEEERMFVSEILTKVTANWVDGSFENLSILPIGAVEGEGTDLITSLGKLSPLLATKVLNSMTTNEIRGIVNLEAIEGGDIIGDGSTVNQQDGSQPV